MKQIINTFGGVAALAAAGIAGLLLFTLIGGLIMLAGLVVTGLLVGGGIYAALTGKYPFSSVFSMRSGGFGSGDVRIFDLRTGEFRNMQEPAEAEMIDVTPPREQRPR